MPILKIRWNTGNMSVDLNQILLMEAPKVKRLFKLMRTSDCRIDKFYGADVDKELLRYLNERAHTDLTAAEQCKEIVRENLGFYATLKPGLTTSELKQACAFVRKAVSKQGSKSNAMQRVRETENYLKTACKMERNAEKYDRIIKTYKDVMHIE